MINLVPTNSKAWWDNVKKITSNPLPIDNRFYLDNIWLTPQSFVETMSSFFNDPGSSTPDLTANPMIEDFETAFPNVSVSIAEVKLALKRINTNKATHTGDFPAWVSKYNAEDIAIPLTDIIN